MRGSYSLGLFLFVFAVLVGVPVVRSTLVFYYSFDDARAPTGGLSGYCPNVATTGSLLDLATTTTTACKFGGCLDTSAGAMELTGQKIFQGSSAELSASLWLGVPAGGINLYGSYVLYQTYVLYLVVAAGQLSCQMMFSTFSAAQVVLTVNFKPNTFTHVACVYDGTKICLYVNNTAFTGCTASEKYSFTEGSGSLQVGSVPPGISDLYRWVGTVDELKFYDHALTATEISQLYGATEPNDSPSGKLSVNGTLYESSSFTTQAFKNVTMTAVVQDSRQPYSGAAQPNGSASITYKWEVLTTTCGGVEVASPTTPSALVSFLDVSSSTLKLCVSDGEVAREVTLSMSATASVPELIRQPLQDVVQIPENSVDYALSVEGSSLPPPSYQWQRLVTITINKTTDLNVTTREYLDADPLDLLFSMRMLDERLDEREEVEVQVFQSIPGATYSTLLLNGSLEWDEVVLRCLIFNSGGSVPTKNLTIRITSPLAPSPAPDSGSDAALIGGIVGGVGGGLVLLCLLLILAVLLVVLSKRRKRAYQKLKQPDYDAVAYGDVKEEIALPKKQTEEYAALERLIGAPDHQLAFAICGVANSGERDAIYRSVLRVLAGQYQAYNFLARSISMEVAEADEEGTLFRSNSSAAKLFSLYMRMIGLKYLWHVLVLSVRSLNDNARETDTTRSTRVGGGGGSSAIFGNRYKLERDDVDDDDESTSVGMDILGASSMELDPQKLDEASDLDINTLELWLTVQKMFKLIMQSEKTLPQELRMLIRRIHDEVERKFSEEAVFRAMGGFFFLRLICPALLAPQLHGLLDEPPHPVAHRQLILVTKVLQNLANDTLPGAKEAYMEKLNAFIVANKPALDQFYSQIVNHPEQGKLADSDVPPRARNDALIKLRKFIDTNLNAIESALRGSEEGGEDVVDELRQILHKEASDERV